MGDVVSLRGDAIVADAQDDMPFEPDPALIAGLEEMLAKARAGELISYIAVYEKLDGIAGTSARLDDAENLSTLLTGLATEQYHLTKYLAEEGTRCIEAEPPESA